MRMVYQFYGVKNMQEKSILEAFEVLCAYAYVLQAHSVVVVFPLPSCIRCNFNDLC